MQVGSISEIFNKKFLVFLVLQFVAIVGYLGYERWYQSGNECAHCHSNPQKMSELGYPELVVTEADIASRGKHPFVKCHDCHLGNPRRKDPDTAHKGMLKAILINHDAQVITRKGNYKSAIVSRDNASIYGSIPDGSHLDTHLQIRNVLWHDRDPETFNFDPEIAKKTCGKPNCHPTELKQFTKTTMATNFRQRTMKTWTDPYGPHNCGPSFADLPPEAVLKKAGFDLQNQLAISANLNIPFTQAQAIAKQKFCNVCHTGCIDCHYAPTQAEGSHHFVARPHSLSCAGFGRGTSICHPGAMQSRRGETYIGGQYSIPTGMKPDTHYLKNIHCTDCHMTGSKGMGDKERKATCQDCHIEIEEAHKKGIHKNMDCATCHISELRGYQITIWGPGVVSGQTNPFKKYSLYYGIQSPPIIMKDQHGRWMPIKVMPHSVGNIKNPVAADTQIRFRWADGQTRDAYYIVGTKQIGANDNHLLWLELQQASHPFTKARSCKSCHSSHAQTSRSQWTYMDEQGAKEEFTGSYRIIADEKTLKIIDLKAHSQIKLANGYKLEDFASWVFLKDAWQAPGDFAIKTDKVKYQQALKLLRAINHEHPEVASSKETKKQRTIKIHGLNLD